MSIKFSCKCGQPITTFDEHAGRRVRCKGCGAVMMVPGGVSPELPVDDLDGALPSPGSSAGYVYKMVQVPPVIEVAPGASAGQQAASYLQGVVNAQASKGWEFYRTDSIGVRMPPGCMGALFGMTATTEHYYVVTFRRPGDPASQVAPDPIDAVQAAARQRAQQQAREVAQREADAVARAEGAIARRADREAELRAKGIEPGPMAWFKELPDLTQALLLGIAITIPVLVAMVLMIASSGRSRS